MAILNVTPDSFYAGSRTPEAESVERRVREAVSEGAQLIDVGGYSSRPGADEVPADEEWRRVRLGVGTVRRLAPGMTVSVDTFRSEVAAKAVETFGPLVVNDISAGELDPAMLSVVADCGVPYIAMHMKGDPKTMQSKKMRGLYFAGELLDVDAYTGGFNLQIAWATGRAAGAAAAEAIKNREETL